MRLKHLVAGILLSNRQMNLPYIAVDRCGMKISWLSYASTPWRSGNC